MTVFFKSISGMLLVAGMLVACDNSSTPIAAAMDTPAEKHAQSSAEVKDVLSRFIDVSIRRLHADYYDMLSTKDQAVKSKEKYLEEQGQLQPNLADHYFEKISYHIETMNLDGNSAQATVILQFPDVERMIKQVYNLAILGEQALPPLDEMKQQIDMEYLGKPLPMKTRTRHFTLLQEQGQWRVYVGWDKTLTNTPQ